MNRKYPVPSWAQKLPQKDTRIIPHGKASITDGSRQSVRAEPAALGDDTINKNSVKKAPIPRGPNPRDFKRRPSYT